MPGYSEKAQPISRRDCREAFSRHRKSRSNWLINGRSLIELQAMVRSEYLPLIRSDRQEETDDTIVNRSQPALVWSEARLADVLAAVIDATVRMSDLIEGRTGAWEVVIGLEVHAQVTARAKLFSGAATDFGAEPNTQVSTVDAAFPGMLPVINRHSSSRRSGPGSGSTPRSTSTACSTARTTSTPTCRPAIRSRNTSSRSWAAAASCSTCRTARPARSASPGCIWSRTPARACTTSTRARPMST